MLDNRGAGAGAGAGAGLQEGDQADYGGSPSNGVASKRGGGAKGGFDKAVDDEIPF
jgi:single-strand DNA-binding protein